ncbi:MAG: FAD-binding oxidoreductase [Candidatus Thermoplasmatota archaeon]
MAASKWWGWGAEGTSAPLESRPHLHAYLRRTLGLADERLAVPDLASVPMPPSRMGEPDLAAFRAIVGGGNVTANPADRLAHALGKSYRDLMRLRLGGVAAAPDVVLYPEEEDHVRQVLARCAERGIAVVPFGGGSSVVGGVEVTDPRPHVALDLRRMSRVLAVDAVSLTATAEAGILGPALEAELNRRHLTLGHFPQSFEFSTLGGWIAARSAGALSNRYGKIEDLVAGLRLVAPSGTLDLRARPRHAMGPDLLGLAVGSEGTLGVITQATMRVHRSPAARAFDAFLFRNFPEGLAALREMAQDAVVPAMTYLMDEDETRLLVAASGRSEGLGASLLKVRGVDLAASSLLLLGHEGTAAVVKSSRAHARSYCAKGVGIGSGPAEQYSHERYEAPYLRDSLIDHRIMVETVETATTWSNLERLHAAATTAIRGALESAGTPGIVGCHVSHVYTEGASLYFTWMARQKRGEELAQYDAAKGAAMRAVVDAGGHVSHHHGIGSDHVAYFREAVGEPGIRLLRDLKARFDPRGIMNPGKLFPVSP